jgi:uncharacterized membrane protein
MTGLIILIILIPLVFLILLITILNKTTTQQQLLESLYDKIKELKDEINILSKQSKEQPGKKIAQHVFKEDIPQPAPENKPISKITTPEPAVVITETFFSKETTIIEEKKPISPGAQKPGGDKGWWDRWLENNPDLEKFIGENLANKIGIAVLVLGIAFFVKYAIDKNWIRESGRVIIGLISGGFLIGLAHYIRKSYRSFSSVLVGGGLSVFYFTIAFAFHQYHLISQQAAFIIMVIITAFAVVLSLTYDRLELAILATIGGFAAPFLVSTGQENYVALFTYLCILNTGLMVLAWFKRWPAINTIALFFTLIIFGGWLGKTIWFEENKIVPYKNALFFASLFYVQFVTMNIINNLRLKHSFTAFDFIIVLSINFLYFTAGMIILPHWNEINYKGLFTVLLGLINLTLAWLFFNNSKVDRNFVSLLIGLTLTFISLAAPVQLKGNYITLFWAAETVVLFWLYQRSKITLMKIASLIIAALMLVSLLMDWSQIYFATPHVIAIIINKGFTTTLVAAAALFIYHLLIRKEPDADYLGTVSNKRVNDFLLTGSVIIAYLAGVLEIFYQFNTRFPAIPIYAVYLQLYSFAVILSLLRIFRQYSLNYPLFRIGLTLIGFAFYILNLHNNYQVSIELLTTGNNQLHFIAHWLAAILLFKLLYDLITFFRKNQTTWSSDQPVFTWIVSAGLVLLLSVEMYHFILWSNYRNEDDWVYWKNLYYKAGLSILWSISSFIMMWLGMKNHFRTLRIISLSLFTITLAKLFIYDIRNIPPGGKIAAFILLGILLLTVSFMYQRLKKIIIDDIGKKTT